MKNSIKMAALAVVASFFFAACGSQNNEATPTAEALPVSLQLTPEQMEMAGIELGKPEKRVISGSIGCTGKVEVPPESLASVYSPVNGFVTSVRHLPGEFVKKGELLTTVQHPDLVKLQREFLEGRSRLSFLEKDFDRKKTLNEADASSQRAFEQAEADLQFERARLKGLTAELKLLGINTDKLAAGGDIQSTIALVSPISGYVVAVNVNKGKLVGPTDLLYQMVDNSHVHLELEVFAKDVPLLKKGQRIEAYLPGNAQTYEGEIYLVGKMIDPATKTTMVHGHFKKAPIALIPGTYLQANIFTAENEVWAVPETAIVRQGDAAFVFVKKGAGFEKVKVETGQSADGFVALQSIEPIGNQQLARKGAYYLNGSEE